MAEHTPTPWRVEKSTGLVWGDCTLFDDGTPDRLGVPVTDGQLERPWAQGKGPSYEEMEANAALIVKAVNHHDALVKALQLARNRIHYLGVACSNPKHYEANQETFLPAVDEVLNAVVGSAGDRS